MADEAGGVTSLERAVFSLQDKLQEAGLLEGRPGAIDALLAVVEFLSSISSPGADRHPGSFRINLKTGRWADFATDEKGGDPVSLYAYIEAYSQAEAARLLARMLGMEEARR